MLSVEIRLLIGLENSPFAVIFVHTFQPGSFTGLGSERVKTTPFPEPFPFMFLCKQPLAPFPSFFCVNNPLPLSLHVSV